MTEQNQLNWQRDNFENIEEAWKDDLWDRKRLGEQLTHYVDRLNCGAVLALDARWGEGKTWFVRHWQKHLEDEKHNVIYLDAFANDYLDDPFLVVTSEITNILSKDKKTKGKVEKLIDLSASVGSALLPSLPKIALTLGLHLIGAGFFNSVLQQGYENAKDEIDKLSDEASDRIKESIQEKIVGHEAEKKTLSEFKKHLAETVVKLDKPLVFIIDELDRCRPDFAIRLIERIKHFFDIKNIVFVLVMDKAQFSKVICHNYGYDEALGEEYLDKFVDFEVSLKKKSLLPYEEIYEIIEEYLSQIGFVRNSSNKGVIGLISVLYLYKKINMRALLKIVNKVSLFQVENNLKNEFLVYLLFDIDVLNRFNKTEDFLEYVRSDLIGLTEYCLLDRIVGIESSMPEEELKKLQGDGLSKLVFNSTLNSELLLNIDMLLEKNEKAYFKMIDWLSKDLFENPYEGNLIENWKKYLFI